MKAHSNHNQDSDPPNNHAARRTPPQEPAKNLALVPNSWRTRLYFPHLTSHRMLRQYHSRCSPLFTAVHRGLILLCCSSREGLNTMGFRQVSGVDGRAYPPNHWRSRPMGSVFAIHQRVDRRVGAVRRLRSEKVRACLRARGAFEEVGVPLLEGKGENRCVSEGCCRRR
jgi:hypothetical protein